ncbi:MAG: PH domain-containing protein [Candidatus Bathyarchaeia archaeon]
MSSENKPRVSRKIAWSYMGLTIFVYIVAVFFAYVWLYTPMGLEGLGASIVTGLVGVIILLILRSFYQTRYILDEGGLVITTTRLIGGDKVVPLDSVESVEKTLIPAGIKLFGASFHGGYYKIPGLGRAFLAITNFENGLLLKTTKGNFIINPRNPTKFKEKIELKTRQKE